MTWVYGLSILYILWFIVGFSWTRRAVRQAILEEALKQDGPEGRKAMESRLNGEWR